MTLDITHTKPRSLWHTSRNLQRYMTALIVLCAAATSCDSNSGGPESGISQARIMVDWSGYDKEIPSGMTVIFHHSGSGEMTRVSDNNIASVSANLLPGRYWAMMFNLTPGEFDNISFRQLESAADAEAYAREYTGRIWHSIPRDEYSYVACQPEWLAADTILTADVGKHPLQEAVGTLHPRNLTRTLHVNVTLGNPSSIISARAAVSGLAAGCRLSEGTPAGKSPAAIHLIESSDWTLTKAGVASAEVRCFGLPSGHQGLPEENIFEFQALLRDGKTIGKYMIPVGHLIKQVSDGNAGNHNLRLDLQLELPQTPGDDSGDMDIRLETWDESIDHDIPL